MEDEGQKTHHRRLDAAEIGRISAIGRETFTKEMFPEFL